MHHVVLLSSAPIVSDSKKNRSQPVSNSTAPRLDAPPLPVLIHTTGVPVTPKELRLTHGSCVVGAGSMADIIVEDRAVSRRHVELTLVPEGVEVQDLGSRNGTFYLGEHIKKVIVAPGSRIRVGAAEVRIDSDPNALGSAEARDEKYRGLIGASAIMRRMFAVLGRMEGSLFNVLVEGESGVGKELVASAIHEGSVVADGPLVTVSCGAINRDLVLSELFGHRRGSFSAATEDRLGAFELAHNGTLFLDQVGELPLDMQPALLRALEAREVQPVGEPDARRVNVRVIAATEKNLENAVKRGRFREDLYRRLAVVKVRVPSLAERAGDIGMLASAISREAGAAELPTDVLAELGQRQWPGNVRELRNAVHAYLAIGQVPEHGAPIGGLLEITLKQNIDADRPYQEQKELFNHLFSRLYFESLLESTAGNQAEAARVSKVDRAYLAKLLSKYGVKK
jgi:DNA-binding NtrC family response regulator